MIKKVCTRVGDDRWDKMKDLSYRNGATIEYVVNRLVDQFIEAAEGVSMKKRIEPVKRSERLGLSDLNKVTRIDKRIQLLKLKRLKEEK